MQLRRLDERVHQLLDVGGALDRRRSSGWPRVTASFEENSWQQSSSGRIEIS